MIGVVNDLVLRLLPMGDRLHMVGHLIFLLKFVWVLCW